MITEITDVLVMVIVVVIVVPAIIINLYHVFSVYCQYFMLLGLKVPPPNDLSPFRKVILVSMGTILTSNTEDVGWHSVPRDGSEVPRGADGNISSNQLGRDREFHSRTCEIHIETHSYHYHSVHSYH